MLHNAVIDVRDALYARANTTLGWRSPRALVDYFAHVIARARAKSAHVIANTDVVNSDTITRVLGQVMRAFASKVCPKYRTCELNKEVAARKRRKLKKYRKVKASTVASKMFVKEKDDNDDDRVPKHYNLNTYKFHHLGDYPAAIRENGTSDNMSSQTVSMVLHMSYHAIVDPFLGRVRAPSPKTLLCTNEQELPVRFADRAASTTRTFHQQCTSECSCSGSGTHEEISATANEEGRQTAATRAQPDGDTRNVCSARPPPDFGGSAAPCRHHRLRA